MTKSPLDDLPEIHPREGAVKNAAIEFGSFISELQSRYELTIAETFAILGARIAVSACNCVTRERAMNK